MIAVHADTWHLHLGSAIFAKVIVSMNKNLTRGQELEGLRFSGESHNVGLVKQAKVIDDGCTDLLLLGPYPGSG